MYIECFSSGLCHSHVSLSLSRTEVIIYLVERSLNGTSKRIPATTLSSFLEQNNVKTQLAQLGVLMSVTRTELSPAQLKQLLQNAPAGERLYVHVKISQLHRWKWQLRSMCPQGWTRSFGSRPRWTTLSQRGEMLCADEQCCICKSSYNKTQLQMSNARK